MEWTLYAPSCSVSSGTSAGYVSCIILLTTGCSENKEQMTLPSTDGNLCRAWVLSFHLEPHTTTQRLARPQAARSPTDRRATTLAWQRPPLSSCSLAPGLPPAAPFLPGLRKLGLWAPGPSWVRELSFPIHSPHTPSTHTHTLNLDPRPFQDPEARASSSATRSRSQAHLSPPYPQGSGRINAKALPPQGLFRALGRLQGRGDN